MERAVREGKGLTAAVREEFRPNHTLLARIGEEIIAGFKGIAAMSSIKFGPRGGVTLTKGAPYPNGIKQQRSPNGAPYIPLKDSTIKMKKRSDRPSGLPPSPTPNMALMDMGVLVDGLDYRVYSNNDGVEVFFKNSDLTALSLRHERGGNFQSSDFTRNHDGSNTPLTVTIPARPHREVQAKVKTNITKMLKAWVRKNKNG